MIMWGLGWSNLFRNKRDLFLAEGKNVEEKKSKIVIANGENFEEITIKVVEKLGGIEKFVKKGEKVVIKPNIAFNKTPQQGANTHPDVVSALVKLCKNTGAKEIVVIDHPPGSGSWNVTYLTSGIKDAVEKAGGIMKPPTNWKKVEINGTEILKEAEILQEVIDCDVLINIPVVKVHVGSKVTLAMKNFMGIVKDRRYFHRTNLHKCIAEITYFIKPKTRLIILDATRIMLTNGPQGPGEIKELKTVIGGTDIVALDAYGTTLLGKKPEEVPHIKIASEMGLGVMDLEKVDIHYV
jgi:uncharacterized protein (DUF362 family)